MDKGFHNTLEELFVDAGVTAANSSSVVDKNFDPFDVDDDYVPSGEDGCYDPFDMGDGVSLKNVDISDYDPFSSDDGVYYFEDDRREKEEEKWAFENIPKHGVHAHAYKKKLDNLKMKKLKEDGYTYRQIAKQLKCSPNTVRNRLIKLGVI